MHALHEFLRRRRPRRQNADLALRGHDVREQDAAVRKYLWMRVAPSRSARDDRHDLSACRRHADEPLAHLAEHQRVVAGPRSTHNEIVCHDGWGSTVNLDSLHG